MADLEGASSLLTEKEAEEIFYKDDLVKVTGRGVLTLDKFYPIREIRKVYLQRETVRFVWTRIIISALLLLPALAMGEGFIGKGPVGFLTILGLTAPFLLVGGGAVFSLVRPSYYLYFQTFLYDERVLESQSIFQIVRIKKAILKAIHLYQKEEAAYEKSGKILNFF
ncbi:hypothetical protein FAI40_07900 [Acetobacteraceae bacterium]|nr:hypothetical protein FAI40_07900 [Acetobacteraceae bacterium]